MAANKGQEASMRIPVLLVVLVLAAVLGLRIAGSSQVTLAQPPQAHVAAIPFVAEYEARVYAPDGMLVQRSREMTFADAFRRRKVEATFLDAEGRVSDQITVIADPVAKIQYTLRPLDRTGSRRVFEGRPASPNVSGPNYRFGTQPWQANAQVEKEDLGIQSIAGIPCRGIRQRALYPSPSGVAEETHESWGVEPRADGLVGASCKSVHVNPDGERVEKTLLWIRVGEVPSPDTFMPPKDYKISEQIAPSNEPAVVVRP